MQADLGLQCRKIWKAFPNDATLNDTDVLINMKVASSEIIIAHLTLLTRSKTLNSERVNNIDKILKKVISQQGLPLVIVLFDIEFFSYDHSLSLSLSLSCAQRREEQKKQIHEMAYYDPAPSV